MLPRRSPRFANDAPKGRGISFFAWMVKAISTVIAENRYIHALIGRKHHTVVFEETDISVMVEKVVEGNHVPLKS